MIAVVQHRSYTHFMPTVKRRISICVDDQLFDELAARAEEEQRPVASLGLDLIRRAMQLEEDAYFSKVSDSRVAKKEKRVSHSKAWK